MNKKITHFGLRPEVQVDQTKKIPLYDRIQGEVRLYPYRSASASHIIMRLPRAAMHQFEQMLAEATGRSNIGNHDVYELRQENYAGGRDMVTYFQFSDSIVLVGSQIEEARY